MPEWSGDRPELGMPANYGGNGIYQQDESSRNNDEYSMNKPFRNYTLIDEWPSNNRSYNEHSDLMNNLISSFI